jgi:glutamyl-tRNA synthetase
MLPAMNPNPIVTRFAPSPTGHLQIGNARSALFPWLLARHLKGKFFLRMEDTDLARSSEDSVRSIVADLKWLGLDWDNPELMYQSQRVDLYNRIIEGFLEKGLAYKAYETPEELDAQRKAAERAKRAYLYRRPQLTDEQLRQFESEGRPHVVRFAMPVKEYRFDDVVLGKTIVLDSRQVQDFVIRKTDGMPTYHFAVVIDDAEMGVTHILRGQEHLLNTVNHIALQEALGYPRPTYGHLPIILNNDGSKMSKRDRDKKIRLQASLWLRNMKLTALDLAAQANLDGERLAGWLEDSTRQLDPAEQAALMPMIGLSETDLPEILIRDFRKSGYLPEVLLNFIALLGWSPGGDRERMSVAEMVELFSIEGIGKSNARFNRDKLLAFNTEASTAASADRLLSALRDYLSVNPDSPLNNGTDDELKAVLAMNAGFHILREVDEKSRFFFLTDEEIRYDPKTVDKFLKKNEAQGTALLNDVLPVLEQTNPWTAGVLEEAIKRMCDDRALGLGKIAQPIRVALSGSAVSPPIFETLELLGQQRTVSRIRHALSVIS